MADNFDKITLETYDEFKDLAQINNTWLVMWVQRSAGQRWAVTGCSDIMYRFFLKDNAAITQFDTDFPTATEVSSMEEVVSKLVQTNTIRRPYPVVPDYFKMLSGTVEALPYVDADVNTHEYSVVVEIPNASQMQGGQVAFSNPNKGEKLSIEILYPEAWVNANLVPGEVARSWVEDLALVHWKPNGWDFERYPKAYALIPANFRIRFRYMRGPFSLTPGEMYCFVDLFEKQPTA